MNSKADRMEVIEQHQDWLRLVQVKDHYRVQMRLTRFFFWHRWHTVTFGPYGPYPVGLAKFTILHIILRDYRACAK